MSVAAFPAPPAPAAPPIANPESEYALLSRLLYDPSAIDTVADFLAPADFSEGFYGRIYGLIVDSHARGTALNPLTLRPHIEQDPGYRDAGGAGFIASLTNALATMVPARATAAQIRDLARRRRLVAGLGESIALGADVNASLEAVVDSAESALAAATAAGDTLSQPSAADAVQALMQAADGPRRSVHCGTIPSLDALLGGMRPKQLVIGGGRPGMGKTAAALSYSLGAAANGHGVLYVSLEMSAPELAARMAADLSFDGHRGIPYAEINADAPTPRAFRAMADARDRLRAMPLQLVDAGSLSVGRLELLVRRHKRRFAARGGSLDLVVVDYLQLLRCDERQKSAYEAVSEISRRLKGIAKDHDVAILALAQLSRALEQRADRKPILSDLRESGQIEQDADAVIFFYRHEYYLRQEARRPGDPLYRDWQQSIADCQGAIDFICAKRRNGVTGSALGEFHGAYQAVRG